MSIIIFLMVVLILVNLELIWRRHAAEAVDPALTQADAWGCPNS